MAKTILKVTVFGGVPPMSIKTQLFQGGEVVKGFEKDSSFEHTFNDLEGRYTLMISGPNPLSEDRKTVLSVSTDEITLSNSSDPSPSVRKGKAYLVQFHFRTK